MKTRLKMKKSSSLFFSPNKKSPSTSSLKRTLYSIANGGDGEDNVSFIIKDYVCPLIFVKNFHTFMCFVLICFLNNYYKFIKIPLLAFQRFLKSIQERFHFKILFRIFFSFTENL
jgi:hypothetical protein